MKNKSILQSLRFLTLLGLMVLGIGNAWGGNTVTLTNAKIVSAGDANTGYATWNISDGNGYTWNAYAIKNQHSKATSSYHYLQIKKYASSTAYYIQVPTMPGNITQLKMTVSGSSQPMTGGGNSATLYFSASNSTAAEGTGVANGTGASSITIDASSLKLNTGYITASGAIRIWDIEVTYSTGNVPVTGVSLNKTTLNLEQGGNETLTATVAPDDATNKNVTWESSNTAIATVDAKGLVTALSAGTANITVTTEDGSKTATCAVTVSAPISVTGVSLNKSTTSIEKGKTETLVATVAPDNASNKNVTWSSDNESVATVSNGLVTAVSAGTANITVTTEDGSKTATCEVTVTEPVDYVNIPFKWNGGTSTELLANVGVTANGLGDDYAESHAPYRVKLDNTGDYILIKTNEAVGSVKVNVKMIGGKTSSKITVQGATTLNDTYNNIQELTISGSQNDICQLSTTNDIDDSYRFIRLYFTRGANVGVGYIELTKAAAKHTVTFASTENGSFTAAIGGNPVTTGTQVKAGSTVSLTSSPSLHYHLNAWNVYKTGESGTTVTVENNSFIMPDHNVTIGATFEEDTKYTVTAKGNIGGKYTVKVGDADSVEVNGLDVTFSNLYANTAFTLTSVSANDGYKIGSTPFALAVEDGKTKPTLSKTDNDNVKTFTLGDCDVTITASFPKLYNIIANNGIHGTSLTFQDKDGKTITKASYKTNVTVMVGTPNEGYQLDRLYYITDEEVDTPVEVTIENNKFEMPQYNVTVYATYKVIPYTLTYAKGDESVQGEVPVDKTVYSIENPTATLASADGLTRTGYVFAGWSDGNAVYQPGAQYTVTGNTTMTAQWTAVHKFTALSSDNGTFSATYGGETCYSNDVKCTLNVPAGQTVILTASPATDYRCDGFIFDGSTTATPTGENNTWTFVMPDANESAMADFVSTVATFAASVDESIEHGSIALTPASGVLSTQKIGDKIYLSNTPDTHYKLTEWLFYDDNLVLKEVQVYVEDGTNNQYFLMPGYNVTVSATFSEYYTITTSVSGNGSIGVQLGDQVAPNTTIDCYVGTSVTATATPASEDYEFKSWTITGTEYSSTNNVATFTMPSQNVSITATFDAIPKFTLTYHIKGVSTKIENVRRDTNVKSLLSEVVTGDNFHAWSTTEDATLGNLLSNEATMQADMDVYAVYAVAGDASYKLVESSLSDWRGDYLIAYSDDIFMDGSLEGGRNGVGASQSSVDPNEALSNDKKTITSAWGNQHYVTIEAIDDQDLSKGYVIKSHSTTTPYFYHTGNSNGMSGTDNKSTAANYPLNITFNSSSDIRIAISAGAVLHFNNSTPQSGGQMFRFYKDGSQSAIYLYKKQQELIYSLEIPYSVTLNSIDGDHFYGTVCLPTDFTIATDDVKAFKAAKSGSVVTMTSITEETNHVAAGEPVVLYCKAVGQGGSSMTATLTKNVTEKVDAPKPSDGNVLSGTFSDIVITDATKSDYLGFGAATISGVKQVGFFSIKSGNKIGAYKAYIDTKEHDIKSFVLDLDDTPTGVIEITDTNDSNTTIYNLGGQRINKLQKGINIVNGRKILF